MKLLSTTFSLIWVVSISLIGCSSSKKVESVSYNPIPITPIEVTLVVNKGNYEYQFKFLNDGSDTIDILLPETYGKYCYFKLFTSDNNPVKYRCVTTHRTNELQWVRLFPHRQVVVDGIVTLEQFFCRIAPDHLLAVTYLSPFKINNRWAGWYSFVIPPFKLVENDSIVVNTILF